MRKTEDVSVLVGVDNYIPLFERKAKQAFFIDGDSGRLCLFTFKKAAQSSRSSLQAAKKQL
jgi:hypothetical protein